MKKAFVCWLGVLSLLSGACMIAVVDRSSDRQSWPLQSEFHKSLDLEAGGAVNLANAEGDIEISGWDEEKVDIVAHRRRELPSRPGLYFMSGRFSSPDIRVRKSGDSVRIKTEGQGYKAEGSIVHYTLKVPRSVRLDRVINGRGNIRVSGLYGKAVIEAEEGRVMIDNFSGSLDIRLQNGGVEAELLDERPGDVVGIKVDKGDISVSLEPGIAASFFLVAPAGNVSSEIDLGQALPAQEVEAKTGEGGVIIELIALQGDIKIRKAEEST